MLVRSIERIDQTVWRSHFGTCSYSFPDEYLTLAEVMGHACCGAQLAECLGEDVSSAIWA